MVFGTAEVRVFVDVGGWAAAGVCSGLFEVSILAREKLLKIMSNLKVTRGILALT
jgi:hypothetical protein